MTYDLSPTSSTSSTYGQESTNGGGVRDQARQVGSEAANAGGAVAQTAKEQGTRGRSARPGRQARNLYGEARTQIASQTGEQQRRRRRWAAFAGRRDALDGAEQGGQAGPVSELAHQAADRVHGVAGWLEEREPGDLIARGARLRPPQPGHLPGRRGRARRARRPADPQHRRRRRRLRQRLDGLPRRRRVRPGPDRGHPDPAARRARCRTAATSTRPPAATPSRPSGGYADPIPGGYDDPTRAATPSRPAPASRCRR